MNIEIQKTISEYPKQNRKLLLTFLENPALIVCVLIFCLLLTCESYYKNALIKGHDTIYIGGLFSILGLVLLVGVVRGIHKKRQEFQKENTPATGQYYVILNDECFERGVKKLWSEKKNWQLLTGFDERANAFWLSFGQKRIPVFKYEFKQPTEIDEFRGFLKKRPSVTKNES